MALALVHHLAIGRNVPLPMVAEVLARMAPQLIVEWVPKDDPMVQRLLSAREDVFADYNEEGFVKSFERRYRIEERIPLPESSRVMFRMARPS
jgi:hypothetical protein